MLGQTNLWAAYFYYGHLPPTSDIYISSYYLYFSKGKIILQQFLMSEVRAYYPIYYLFCAASLPKYLLDQLTVIYAYNKDELSVVAIYQQRYTNFHKNQNKRMMYNLLIHKGSRKKSSFHSGPATKRGGGKGCATKVKRNFFIAVEK